MKKIIILLLLNIFPLVCLGQMYGSETVVVQYEHRPSQKCSQNRSLTIFFLSGFEDSLEVYINGRVITRDYFFSEESTSSTGKRIKVHVGKKLPVKLLEVKNINSGHYLALALDWRYKLLRIHQTTNEWIVLYSDRKIIVE